MYSNHIKVTTGTRRQMLLADFWVQSEKPLSIQESRHIVTQMGWDTNQVNHQVVECLQIDDTHQGHMTLVEATLAIPSYRLVQLDNGERCWEENRWHECALIDSALTESAAYNLAVNWALHSGMNEFDVIGSIKVNIRYIEKFQLTNRADDPF